MSKKRPWMPLYIADFLVDTTHLNAAETGAYLLLIMRYWVDGCLPKDDRKLARIARMTPSQWSKAKVGLKLFFDSAGKQKRIDAELAKVSEISNKRKAAALQKHVVCTPFAPANADTLHTSHSTKKKRKEESLSPLATLISMNGTTISPLPIERQSAKPYSEEFETKFWKPFPRTPIMSKKEAWQQWVKLSPEQRQASCQAIEPYKRHLRQNPTLHAVHACRFLSQNRAEGILEQISQRPDIRGHFA